MSKQPNPLHRELVELQRRLRLWWGMRHIEEGAYLLGMHVLAKMVRLQSLEVVGTWEEFTNSYVMRGKELVAGPVDSRAFMYLGALQQLHSVVGLLSSFNQQGIEEAKEEAKVSPSFTSQHFTKDPDSDPDLISGTTPMLFVFVEWSGFDVDATWEAFQGEGAAATLPAWLKE